MGKISAVLFDFDGTLVDSERLYIEAGVRALGELGVAADYAYEFNRQYFAGLRSDQKPGAFVKEFPQLSYDVYQELYAKHAAVLETTMPVTLKPGVLELLPYIKAQGLKLALVTMSSYDQVKARCAQVGLDFSIFDYFFGGNEVPAKPDPTVYQMAMHQIGVTPAETMIVEDSNVGALAAIRAGATVVVVKDEAVLSQPVLDKANYIFEKNCLIRVKELL